MVQEKLRELLEDLRIPELFLLLGKENSADTVEWKSFRTGAAFYDTTEAGIASLYLAHLAQWCQTEVFTLNGSLVAPNDRLVLDPQPFVDFLENKMSNLKKRHY